MEKTFNKILIIILAVISVLFLVGNLTLALMYDRKENTGIIQFSQHKLDIEIVGKDSVILSPEELTVGSSTTRTLNIKNPQNSTSCVLRIWLEFYIEGNVDTNYLTCEIANDNFLLNENGKYYYKNVLNTNTSIDNLVINFKVSSSLTENYQGKKYTLKLFIESIQSTTEAVKAWQDDYAIEWYEGIKNSLT